jgi:PleD family two-component response regulator
MKFDTLNGLLNQADEYLYRAKEAGRNMVIGDE